MLGVPTKVRCEVRFDAVGLAARATESERVAACAAAARRRRREGVLVLSGGRGAAAHSPSPFSPPPPRPRLWHSLLIKEFRRGIAFAPFVGRRGRHFDADSSLTSRSAGRTD